MGIINISGVQLGDIEGGPLSIRLDQLADVLIDPSIATGQYLRYNSVIDEWQNASIGNDVCGYLDGNVLGNNGVLITPIPGPNTITIGLGNITPLSVTANLIDVDTLNATSINGTLSGNASTATTALSSSSIEITDDTTTNANAFITWVASPSGNNSVRVTSTNLTFNPSTGVLNSVAFNATSTARVKDAIEDLGKYYLDKFKNLRPREYDRKDYKSHEFGFIAEEMIEVYPEVVGKDPDGLPTGIDYGKLSTILTAKIQEQEKIINQLKIQVSEIFEMLTAKNRDH